MERVIYVCVKLTVKMPSNLYPEEVLEKVVSEMEYEMKYNMDGVKIVGTEIIGAQDHQPIGL